MEILSVHDKEFRKYGRIVKGYDLQELMKALAATRFQKKGQPMSLPSRLSKHCR